MVRFVIGVKTSPNRRLIAHYHRPDCREVTSRRGTRPEHWRPYDPPSDPSRFRRPCKVCLAELNPPDPYPR